MRELVLMLILGRLELSLPGSWGPIGRFEPDPDDAATCSTSHQLLVLQNCPKIKQVLVLKAAQRRSPNRQIQVAVHSTEHAALLSCALTATYHGLIGTAAGVVS